MFASGSTDSVSIPWQLSSNHGTNVQLSEKNTFVSSIRKAPASFCFLASPISPSQTLVFNCSPISDDGRQATHYQTVIMVSESNPKLVGNEYSYIFESNVPQMDAHPPNSPFTEIVALKKTDAIVGDIRIELKADGKITCTNQERDLQVLDKSKHFQTPVWVMFESYRTVIYLISIDESGEKVYIESDRFKHEPSNELAENTLSFSPNEQPSTSASLESDETLPKSIYTSGTCNLMLDNMDDCRIQQGASNISCTESEEQRFTNAEKIVNTLVGELKTIDPNNIENNILSDKLSARSKVVLDTSTRLDNIEKTLEELKCAMSQLKAERMVTIDENDKVLNTQTNYVRLVTHMDTVHISDHLYEKDLISEQEMKYVQSRNISSEEQSKALLDIMKKRQLRQSQLVPVLQAVRQEFLVDLFFPTNIASSF